MILATYTQLSNQAYIKKIGDTTTDRNRGGGDSDEESVCSELENLHMTDVQYKYESSIYSTSSDGSQSNRLTPVPDDANSKSISRGNVSVCVEEHFKNVCYFPLQSS